MKINDNTLKFRTLTIADLTPSDNEAGDITGGGGSRSDEADSMFGKRAR